MRQLAQTLNDRVVVHNDNGLVLADVRDPLEKQTVFRANRVGQAGIPARSCAISVPLECCDRSSRELTVATLISR
jgi:hypothetical protein